MNLGTPDERFTISYNFTHETFVLVDGTGCEVARGKAKDLSRLAFSMGASSVKHNYDLVLDKT